MTRPGRLYPLDTTNINARHHIRETRLHGRLDAPDLTLEALEALVICYIAIVICDPDAQTLDRGLWKLRQRAEQGLDIGLEFREP